MLASLEEGKDGVRFAIPTSLRSSKQNSQEDVVDVGYCTPNLVNVCEDLHDDEVDLGDEWRNWHMDDSKSWRAMMRQKRL